MGERMVHSHQAAFFITPLKHRKVNHPEADELVLVAQSQLVTHFKTQLVQLLAGLHGIVTAQNQNQVTRLGVESSLHFL